MAQHRLSRVCLLLTVVLFVFSCSSPGGDEVNIDTPAPVDGISGDAVLDVPAGDLAADTLPDLPLDTIADLPPLDVPDVAPDTGMDIPVDTDPADADVCTPTCDGIECGDDGCGGSCGGCEDDNPCTDDQCVDAACVFDPVPMDGADCDDGNPCTDPDACADGACVGTLLPLDQLADLDCLCAEDADCEAVEDGDLCNGTLLCEKAAPEDELGVCAVDLETILSCDDAIECTADSCDPALGCQNVPDDGECDDGNPCTVDTCAPAGCDSSVPVGDGEPCGADGHWACEGTECVCTPDTCADLGKECGGGYDDGCGGTVDGCGTCTEFDNSFCEDGACGCTPDTCVGLGKVCGGGYDDGCDGTVDGCGTCTEFDNSFCDAGACGCAPDTCLGLGKACGGGYDDGCDGTVDGCGTCTEFDNSFCDVGACSCAPATCLDLGKECGDAWDDGCDATLDCGVCLFANSFCDAGICGCVPNSCDTLEKVCGGGYDDSCGGTVEDCGICTEFDNSFCDNGACGCAPHTCDILGKECATWPNGCGGEVDCGACSADHYCVAGLCDFKPDAGITCDNALDVSFETFPYSLQKNFTGDLATISQVSVCDITPWNAVWFTYTPSVSGPHIIYAANDMATSRSVISVFEAEGCTSEGAPVDAGLACSSTPSPDIALPVDLTEGSSYLVLFHTWSDNEAMEDPTIDIYPASEGQTCNLAVDITEVDFPFTLEGNFPADPVVKCINNTDYHHGRSAVWFEYTPSVSGNYSISATNNSNNAVGKPSTLVVFDDTACDPATDAPFCVEETLETACLQVTLSADETYHILFHMYHGQDMVNPEITIKSDGDCVCYPDCDVGACGSDGCGGTCNDGNCGSNEDHVNMLADLGVVTALGTEAGPGGGGAEFVEWHPLGTKKAALSQKKQVFIAGGNVPPYAINKAELVTFNNPNYGSEPVYPDDTTWLDNSYKNAIGADLDGDGADEILIVYYAPALDELKYIYMDYNKVTSQFDYSNGSISGSSDIGTSGIGGSAIQVQPALAAGDLDGNGKNDNVAIGFAGHLFVLKKSEGQGAGFTTFQKDYQNDYVVFVAIGEVDGDQGDELAVTYVKTAQKYGYVDVFDQVATAANLTDPVVKEKQLTPVLTTGAVVPGGGYEEQVHIFHETNVAIGDVTGDQRDEIVFFGREGTPLPNNLLLFGMKATCDAPGQNCSYGFIDKTFYESAQTVVPNPIVVFDAFVGGKKEVLAGNRLFKWDHDTGVHSGQALTTTYSGSLGWGPLQATAANIDTDQAEELIVVAPQQSNDPATWVYETNSNGVFAQKPGAISLQKDGYAALTTASTDTSGITVVEYIEHIVRWTDPTVLAVLASPPCWMGKSCGGNTYTSFGQKEGETISEEQHVGFSAGVMVGSEFNVLGNGAEVKATVESSFDWYTKESSSTTKTVSWTADYGSEMVVFSAVPYDVYHYEVKETPSAEPAGGITPPQVGDAMLISVPRDQNVYALSLETYNSSNGSAFDVNLQHEAGNVCSYQSAPTAGVGITYGPFAVPEIGWIEASIDSEEETGEGTSGDIEVKIEASVTIASATIGASVGFNYGWDYEVTNIQGSIYTGRVEGLGTNYLDYNYDFGLWVHHQLGSNSKPYVLVDYWVHDAGPACNGQ